jgi:hypothetical protein
MVSLNGGLPQVLEKIPYENIQSCQAEKAARDSRVDNFVFANTISIKRNVFCLEASTLVG